LRFLIKPLLLIKKKNIVHNTRREREEGHEIRRANWKGCS
jgi:hypothetical protein